MHPPRCIQTAPRYVEKETAFTPVPPMPMYPDPGKNHISLDTARIVSSSQQPTNEPMNWTDDMDGVARRLDRDSFMRIYDHFMPRLCVYLRGLGTTEAVAEELAQECLLRVWQRASDFDATQGTLSTWLYRIARNLHIDRVRRERSWIQVQAAVENAAVSDAYERSSAEQYSDQARLRQRINELPAVQARLVRMSYFEAKSHSEIADALGMPLGTVKSHLRRAFLQLQSKVGGAP